MAVDSAMEGIETPAAKYQAQRVVLLAEDFVPSAAAAPSRAMEVIKGGFDDRWTAAAEILNTAQQPGP